MGIYSVIPYFLILLIILSFYNLPIFKVFSETPQGVAHRFGVLDGLRGILALSVVFHHLAINYKFQETGIWALPPSHFYTMLGQVGVSLFFMITGFLFTGKMISENHVRWTSLYVGRIFRIGPLYVVAIVLMIFVVFFRTKFQLMEPPLDLVKKISSWLALGIVRGQPDINGYLNTRYILAGVTWSIGYEWLFYFSLIFIRPFRKYHRIFSMSLLIISILCLFKLKNSQVAYACLFACGIFTRSWVSKERCSKRGEIWLSVACLIALTILFTRFDDAYAALPIIFSLAIFFMICSGATIFGLLNSAGAHRFGNISYGVYLMQGLPITVIYSISGVRGFALSSVENYWLVGFVCVISLILMSSLGYLMVEKPFIAIGRELGGKLQSLMDRSIFSRLPKPSSSET